MTLPSSKMKRVTFEDPDVIAQRPHRNATLAQTPLHGAAVMAPDRGIQGQYHNAKRDDANRLAAAIMATNKSKAQSSRERPWHYDQKRVGLAPFGRSEGIYNATNNIWLNAPKNEYEDIYGGVLSTSAGQTFKAKKLAQRVVNLNARENVTASVGATVPTNSKLSDVTYSPPPSLVSLETALNDLQTSLVSGSLTENIVSQAIRFYGSLINAGPKLELAPLNTIRQALEGLLQRLGYVMNLDPMNSSKGGLSAERFRVAQNMLLHVLRARDVVIGLIKTVDFSEKERRLAMGSILSSAKKYDPATPVGREKATEYYKLQYPQYFTDELAEMANLPPIYVPTTGSGKLANLTGGCDCPDEDPKKKRF